MSDKYEMTGRIKLIGETQAFASGFTKREFVITTADKYPQDVKFDAVKEGCDRLDALQVGDELAVCFNVRGNEHNGRHFVSLQAWKFGLVDSAPPSSSGRATGQREAQGARSSEFGQPERRSASQNGAGPPADDFQEDDDIPF